MSTTNGQECEQWNGIGGGSQVSCYAESAGLSRPLHRSLSPALERCGSPAPDANDMKPRVERVGGRLRSWTRLGPCASAMQVQVYCVLEFPAARFRDAALRQPRRDRVIGGLGGLK